MYQDATFPLSQENEREREGRCSTKSTLAWHFTTSCLRGNFPILPTRFPLALIGFCALCYTVFPHSSHISPFLWIISRERFNMVWRKCPSGETVPQESDLLLIFSMATNHNARNMRRTKIRWFLGWGPI